MEHRIADLEMKLALSEDLLEAMNHSLYRQQQQIDVLMAEVRALRQQVQTVQATTPRNLTEEIPPHY